MADQFQQPIFDTSRPTTSHKVQTTGSLSSAGWFALILLGGIVMFFIGQIIYNRFVLSADNIFLRSLTELGTVTSGTIALESDFSFQPSNAAFIEGRAAFPFSADVSIAMVSSFNPEMTHSEIAFTLPSELVDALDLDSSVLDLEIIAVDKGPLYIRLAEVFRTPLFDLRTISNQWIEVDVQQFVEQYDIALQPDSDSDANTADTLALYTELYRQYPFIDWHRSADAVINSESAFHLQGELLPEVFVDFINAWESATTGAVLDSYITERLNIGGTFELWIDKESYAIVRTMSTITANDQDFSLQFTLLSELRDINKQVAITVPQTTVSLQEAFEAINTNLGFGQFGNGVELLQPEDQNLRAVQAALELYFEEHLQYPLPPFGGNVLGEHALCLGSGGFGLTATECGGATGIQYINRFENNNWKYYLCSEGNYVVEYPGGFLIPGGVPSTMALIEQINPVEFCQDIDGDGLPLSFEQRYGSDPENPDTDGDGYYDGEEVKNGYNPAGEGELQ